MKRERKYSFTALISWCAAWLGLLAAVCFVFVLPEQIPMQFHGLLPVWYAPKPFIFALPALLFAVAAALKQVSDKTTRVMGFAHGMISRYIFACLSVILLLCEIYTVVFCLWPVTVPLSAVLLTAVAVLAVIGAICFAVQMKKW